MRLGAIFPQTELGGEVTAIRDFARGAESLGFNHFLVYDHVVGADPAVHEGWAGPYDVDTTFHEPLVMFGYVAAITSLELVSGIVILPQRQTVLLAKQAAEVDLLSRGRFRLGVGIGWNKVEYDALGKSFTDRGRRSEEQIALLRELTSKRSVTFHGEHEQVIGAGLAPLPIQRPIPIWIGGASDAAFARAGRIADGWFPQMAPGPELDKAKAVVDEAAVAAGRDPETIGMEGRVNYRGDFDAAVAEAHEWRELGASHLGLNTMGAGLIGVDGHLEVLSAFIAEVGEKA